MLARASSLPATVTETVFATDKLALTVERPITDGERERHARHLSETAAWEAEGRRMEADYAKQVWKSLGASPAAIISVEPSRSNYWELTVTIAGKSAEAVEAKARAYAAEHEGKLPRFGNVEPWHGGFRCVGSRRAQ